jgi:hypothetical protein
MGLKGVNEKVYMIILLDVCYGNMKVILRLCKGNVGLKVNSKLNHIVLNTITHVTGDCHL